MNQVAIRKYEHESDFGRVGQFLIDNYRDGQNLRFWIQPRWEYMHFHPLIWDTELTKIGIAEANGQIVGVVHHEHDEGFVYFQVLPQYEAVLADLLAYAEENFGSVDKFSGNRRLTLFINEDDTALEALAAEHGYEKDDNFYEPNARYDLTRGVPEITLPEGFHLQSLAEENDLRKINRVLWRGFNHPGPPPEDELEGRAFMQSAPNFRHDLTIVAVAPNGDYVSFCGIWIVPENHLTYVEPVATDPDYRRLGLGNAAVLEGLRRTIPLGSRAAWVGSNQPFYLNMGFVESFRLVAWGKDL